MYDYAVKERGYELTTFHNMFLNTGVTELIECGSIKYIIGMSGYELCMDILDRHAGKCLDHPMPVRDERPYSQEYWTGWI